MACGTDGFEALTIGRRVTFSKAISDVYLFAGITGGNDRNVARWNGAPHELGESRRVMSRRRGESAPMPGARSRRSGTGRASETILGDGRTDTAAC
jgi:hypothetical protein